MISRGAREARRWVAAAEGYGTGDVEVELIAVLAPNLEGTGEGWPEQQVLLALGARFLRHDTPRVVLLGNRTFTEGMLESKIVRARDDERQARGEGRPQPHTARGSVSLTERRARCGGWGIEGGVRVHSA